MKVAVVGLGFMGATHARAWGDELAAVVSGDERKLAGDLSGVGGNFGDAGGAFDFSGVGRYRSLEECLRDGQVDAVDICAPTDLHEQLAVQALRAGKHALVEKPMALDGASAERMIREAERAGRVLMCAQVLRFMPEYRAAREALASVGRVDSAAFWRKCGRPEWSGWLGDEARSGGGVFDLLVHDVDYMVQLFGPPEWVSGVGLVGGGEDWIRAEFGYGVPVSAFARSEANENRVERPPARLAARRVTIEGGWYMPSSYPWSAGFRIGTIESIGDATGDGFAEELRYFAECASAGRYPELCPPSDSAMAVRLARLMMESRARNGERLDCSK